MRSERGFSGSATFLLLQERWHLVQLSRGMSVHGWISGTSRTNSITTNVEEKSLSRQQPSPCRLTVLHRPLAWNAQLASTSQNRAPRNAACALCTARPPSVAVWSAGARAGIIEATTTSKAVLAPDLPPPRGMSLPPKSHQTQ